MKDQLIELIIKEGYDSVSACEMADDVIKELQTKPPGNYVYTINDTTITINKGECKDAN